MSESSLWNRHANDLVNISAAVFVSAITFLLLGIAVGKSIPSLEQSYYWLILVALILFSAVVLWISARRVIVDQEYQRKQTRYSVSKWTLKTLKSAGLPDDAVLCLRMMLARARKADASQTELTVVSFDDRSKTSWVLELENELGKSRMKEFEEILIKYSKRELASDPSEAKP